MSPRPRSKRASLSPAPLALLLLLGGCGGEDRPTNVLLISIDSLRMDRAASLGWTHPLAGDQTPLPLVERLASEGVLFSEALSTTSWTLPAHMSLLTGQPDALHGVTDNFKRLNPEQETLAEALAVAGYATAGFWSGPNLHPAFGFSQGFEEYVNCSGQDIGLELFQDQELGDFREAHLASHDTISSPTLVQEAGAWIEASLASGRPFFAFLHCWDPHYDYHAPAELEALFERPGYEGSFRGVHSQEKLRPADARDREHLLALYDAEARWTSDHLEQLLERLEQLEVLDNTLVVLTSDHGEEFFERGHWGHQRTLFDEVVRVPMALRLPGKLPSGVRPAGQARLQDVMPTVLALLDLPARTQLEGVSLLPLIAGESAGAAQHLHLEVPAKNIHLRGLRTPTSKALWDPQWRQGWLFDLQTDPGEQNPLPFSEREFKRATEGPLAALRDALEELEERGQDLPQAWEEGELPPELVDDLQALGYLDTDD